MTSYSIYLAILVSFVIGSDSLVLSDHPAKGNPIVLVPGYGGNRIYAKLQNARRSHIYCEKSSYREFLLWVGVEYLVPVSINCFVDHMQLYYNSSTRRTDDPPGVFLNIKDWGGTSSVDYLTEIPIPFVSSYYGLLTDLLILENHYKRNVSIRGAPFDFRRAPNENQDMLRRLKLLIESTYEINNGRKVILVGHSLGCLYILEMLHHQSQSWKDKYIKSFVSTSGPYAGSMKSAKSIASGDNLGIITIPPILLQNLTRTWPTSAYLLPGYGYWAKSEELILTDNRNYTAYDWEQFYRDVNYPLGAEFYPLVNNLTDPRVPPGVEVHCVFSKGVKTPLVYDWRKKKFPDQDPHIVYGDGDGTVNVRSLDVCLQWKEKQKQPVNSYILNGVDHIGIVRNKQWIRYVQKVALT